uniref:Uncharacterized protein LOC104224561 n=1 Tax=Nicotiana sylvestris TaxID=4096 RepID=A0A1U7W3C0_NICSY
MVGKTKDTLKSRYDLMDLGIRQRLHPIEDGNNILLPVACYALSPEEKLKVCSFIANLKVPDAFSSNISRCVNVQEKKIHGLKCHDHHVLLQDIFPVVIRGLLPKEVCDPIIALEFFFKNIYSKCLMIEDLEIQEAEIPIILSKLHLVFPPAFFDVMVHLSIHLTSEAKLGGPAQYRNMYPIEREYTREIESQSSMRAHKNEFLDWFRAHIFVLSSQGRTNDELISLAVGSAPLVHRYSIFVVNGFKFHTKELALRRKMQNSSVLVRGDDSDSNKEYYGVLEDIYELSYVGNIKVYLFKCHWWDVTRLGRGYKIDKYGFTKIEDEELLNEEVYQQEEADFNTSCTNDQENIIEKYQKVDIILSDTFLGSQDFKVVSERNKRNREKQVTKYTCGTKSFAEIEKSTRNPITGEIDTPDKVWEIQHTRKDDRGELVWVDPQSQQIHGQLQEVVTQQQSEEIEHPMTRDEILSTVLGERTGYVRGKGYEKKPPKKSNMQQASIESSVSFAMKIMRQKMQAEMDRKLQEEREQMAAQLQRNMELELQRKLAEEREQSSVEVDKRIHLEVDKRMHEQFASLMTRMLQQVLAPLLLNNSSSFSAFLLPSFGTILLSLAPYFLVNFSFFNFYPLDNRLLAASGAAAAVSLQTLVVWAAVKKSNMQQASIESSVSFAMKIMRQKMQAEMDRKLQEERKQMAAQLQRNMELELQRKLAEEREQSSVEVDKRIHLEVDKRMHEQFASLMTRMLQQ